LVDRVVERPQRAIIDGAPTRRGFVSAVKEDIEVVGPVLDDSGAYNSIGVRQCSSKRAESLSQPIDTFGVGIRHELTMERSRRITEG
jgi:hypothetical protein